MAKIDEKLNKLYEYLKNYINDNGFPPSIRDICRDMNIKSTATAHYHLAKLQKNGLLNKVDDKKRAISLPSCNINSINVPLIGTVTAGTPIFATENFEGYYPLPGDFSSSSDLFMLKVQGDSMINVGIYNGDKIVVKKQENADNGDIVVALIDDSATVKRFFKKDNKIILHPENDAMQDIVLKDVKILGLVIGLVRKF